MKQKFNFPKSLLSVSLSIAIIMASLSLFMFSIKSSYAEVPSASESIPHVLPPVQVGTAENYIPITIENGYAYWLIFNVTDGYKFRKSPISGTHWGSRTE